MLKAVFTISEKHPSLDGHFPDHAITPGVVTLDFVVSGLLEQIPGASLSGIPQMKFLQPLLPRAEVVTVYKQKRETLYQFSCEVEGEIVLQGQLQLDFSGSDTRKVCDG